MSQPDLFGEPTDSKEAREDERFGRMDALTGCPLRNYFSERISRVRFMSYERGYRIGLRELGHDIL